MLRELFAPAPDDGVIIPTRHNMIPFANDHWYDNLLPSEKKPESSSLLLSISFFVPASMAPRLMLPGRLSSPNPYRISRVNAVLAVDIDNWQVAGVIDPNLHSLLPEDLQNRSRGQLTFSTPSMNSLACSLFRWTSVEEASSAIETKPVFVQMGTCSLSWQEVQFREDRETLFRPLQVPELQVQEDWGQWDREIKWRDREMKVRSQSGDIEHRFTDIEYWFPELQSRL
jgi:hypothetical protein